MGGAGLYPGVCVVQSLQQRRNAGIGFGVDFPQGPESVCPHPIIGISGGPKEQWKCWPRAWADPGEDVLYGTPRLNALCFLVSFDEVGNGIFGGVPKDNEGPRGLDTARGGGHEMECDEVLLLRQGNEPEL